MSGPHVLSGLDTDKDDNSALQLGVQLPFFFTTDRNIGDLQYMTIYADSAAHLPRELGAATSVSSESSWSKREALSQPLTGLNLVASSSVASRSVPNQGALMVESLECIVQESETGVLDSASSVSSSSSVMTGEGRGRGPIRWHYYFDIPKRWVDDRRYSKRQVPPPPWQAPAKQPSSPASSRTPTPTPAAAAGRSASSLTTSARGDFITFAQAHRPSTAPPIYQPRLPYSSQYETWAHVTATVRKRHLEYLRTDADVTR